MDTTREQGSFYRFVKEKTERISALKGEDSWYRITDREDQPPWNVHVIGNCQRGETTFHRPGEPDRKVFSLRPVRKVMNMNYTLHDADGAAPFARLKLRASRGIVVTGPEDRKLHEIVDPRGKLDKAMEGLLGGVAGKYALVANGRVIGEIEPRPRTRRKEVSGGRLKKFLQTKLQGMVTDWCLELAPEAPGDIDHRLLVASVVVLKEQTIKLDQAT